MNKYRRYDWPGLITTYKASGLSQEEFHLKHGIKTAYLKQRFNKELCQNTSPFVQAEVSKVDQVTTELSIHVGRCHIQCTNIPMSVFVDIVDRLA